MAPSTLGTFLRSFTFGHVRQLDRVLGEALRRAWALGAGPGSEQLVIDLDSTICEVCGKAKHGAGYGYTKMLGYHPLIAVRAWTGEVLHVRMRKGAANTQRGAVRFVEELVARVRRAGADRRTDHALRFGLLVQRHPGHPRAPRRRLHDGRAHDQGRDQGRRGHRRVGLDPDRLHRRRRSRGGRVRLQGPTTHRAPHPAGRAPGHAVAAVATLRLRDRLRRRQRSTSTHSTGRMPPSNWPSAT